MKKQSECQYAQLVFDQPSSSSNSRTFATDDSVLYVNPSPQHRRHRGETNYATIDHSRRHGGHGKPSSSKSSRSKSGLMHSASCPFKVTNVMVIHCDPNQNLKFVLAITLKVCISDPMLVKPKCVWEVKVFYFSAVCLQFFKKKNFHLSNTFWLYQPRVRNAYFQNYSQKRISNFDLGHPVCYETYV